MDETILRLFPVLRRSWSFKGQQQKVAISGLNAQRVLFCALNLRTGHRVVMRGQRMAQGEFQLFLQLLRRCYPGRAIWIILDRAGLHTARQSTALAQTLNTELLWLPKQCPELNLVDHLWRAVKAAVSANYQYESIEQHALAAEQYVLGLTNKEALHKAGALTENFWLKKYLSKNFWSLT